MAKKKKKVKLKVKNILICLLIFLIIGFIIYYILMLPINNIYVSGNKIIKESEILSLAQLDTYPYPSFLLTSKQKVKNNLKKNEYIDQIKIKKTLGNKLYIKIKEHRPLCILNNEKILLSNSKELNNDYLLTDIPYLISIIEDKNIKESFIKKFSKVNNDILRQISQIEYLPTNVDKERFFLYMDDGNEVYITLTKIDKINKYNEIVQKMEGTHGIIYLDSGDYVEVKEITEIIDTQKNNENQQENLTSTE